MHITLRQMLLLALIASLLGAAVFGFTVVTMAFGDGGHASCLASVLQGGAQCNNMFDPSAFMSFHRGALSSLVGVVPASVMLLLFGVLLAVFVASLWRASIMDLPTLRPVFATHSARTRLRTRSVPHFWLALLEHSPARRTDA